ncbi:hypothetical protein CSKR_111153, partial [Clonorchis sinensis]
ILSGRPHLDRRTIRVLNQSLWLKSLTARQRCLAGNANALLFLRNNSPHVPTPNLEDQETVFVRPLAIDQPGMRDSVSVAETLPSIAQWVAEVRKPPHHGKVQSLRDGLSEESFSNRHTGSHAGSILKEPTHSSANDVSACSIHDQVTAALVLRTFLDLSPRCPIEHLFFNYGSADKSLQELWSETMVVEELKMFQFGCSQRSQPTAIQQGSRSVA